MPTADLYRDAFCLFLPSPWFIPASFLDFCFLKHILFLLGWFRVGLGFVRFYLGCFSFFVLVVLGGRGMGSPIPSLQEGAWTREGPKVVE